MTVLKKLAAAINHFLFGPVPTLTQPIRKEDEGVTGRPTPPPNLTLVLEALTNACNQLLQQHVRPVVSLSGETVYAIHTIRLLMTPATLPLLRDLNRLPQSIRDRLARACVEKSAGSSALSLDNFYGWTVEGDSAITEGQVVKVLASHENDPLPLSFVFDGVFEMSAHPKNMKESKKPSAAGYFLDYELAGAHGAERGRLREFPIYLGKAESNDLVLTGTYVAACHARISLDQGGRPQLENLSAKSVWLNGEALAEGKPMPLPSQAQINLGGPEGRDGTAGLRLQLDDITPVCPASAEHPSRREPSLSPRSASPLRAAETRLRDHHPPRLAAETRPCGEAKVSTALARVRIRLPDGSQNVMDIESLPFTIGREPDGPGFSLDEQHDQVSRQHLRLVRAHGRAGFLVDNAGSNGTYHQGAEEGEHFVWSFAEGSPDDPQGWLTLGGRSLGPGRIQARLEAARSPS